MIQPYAVPPMRFVLNPATPLLPAHSKEGRIAGPYSPIASWELVADNAYTVEIPISVLPISGASFYVMPPSVLNITQASAKLSGISGAGEEDDVTMDEELDEEELDDEEDEEDDFDEIEEDIDEEDLEGLEEEFEDEEFDEEEDDDLDDDEDIEDDDVAEDL